MLLVLQAAEMAGGAALHGGRTGGAGAAAGRLQRSAAAAHTGRQLAPGLSAPNVPKIPGLVTECMRLASVVTQIARRCSQPVPFAWLVCIVHVTWMS